MDPITQGALGATAVQNLKTALPRKQMAAMLLAGIGGGMAPDLDVFIRSSTDPLLFLEYHRHFTHSLFFIPFGGLIIGLLASVLLGRWSGLSRRAFIGYATAGYATHALLDACTTYGTLLLWPFSNARFAWNVVSVIDPLYTLPIIILLTLHLRKKRVVFARLALVWALAYLGLGIVQRERAESVGAALAESRGHEPSRLEAKPSFGNILIWKTVYEYQGRFYVDAVRTGMKTRIYPGQSVAKLDIPQDLPWLDEGSQQFRDIERFNWFSNDYLAVSPQDTLLITDIRYSLLPHEIKGLWGIRLDPHADHGAHVHYETDRRRDPDLMRRFWAMFHGESAN